MTKNQLEQIIGKTKICQLDEQKEIPILLETIRDTNTLDNKRKDAYMALLQNYKYREIGEISAEQMVNILESEYYAKQMKDSEYAGEIEQIKEQYFNRGVYLNSTLSAKILEGVNLQSSFDKVREELKIHKELLKKDILPFVNQNRSPENLEETAENLLRWNLHIYVTLGKLSPK